MYNRSIEEYKNIIKQNNNSRKPNKIENQKVCSTYIPFYKKNRKLILFPNIVSGRWKKKMNSIFLYDLQHHARDKD